MKKIFSGRTKEFAGESHDRIPDGWDDLTAANPWLKSSLLDASRNSDKTFKLITHPGYCCCEYLQKLNIFTFGRFKLSISFVVIGLPVSVDECGFTGDLNSLIEDYKRRKGLFLILNIHDVVIKKDISDVVSLGNTLPTAIFNNHFKTYDEYLAALRSPYRRRIKIATQKAAGLDWKEIDNDGFDEKLHGLYLNVLKKSRYPLETLDIDFFKTVEGQIFVLYKDIAKDFGCFNQHAEPLAFVLTKWQNDRLHFLFGGMNYDKRDEYDLYYNMLIKILKTGILGNASAIDFGQTAESSKCRIGCHLEERKMIFFSGNRIMNMIVRSVFKFLEYKTPEETYDIFKKLI
ncbi:MAG: hypothetical protein ACYCYI_09665 [Saccharofermentanales bacterium]